MAYYSDFHAKPSCLYRLFDEVGDLLYVGISTNPHGRILAHRRKPWGHLIHHHTTEWHPGRDAALSAERQAIHDEKPAHNRALPLLNCCLRMECA